MNYIKLLSVFLLIILCSPVINAQIDTRFVKHLSDHELKTEHFEYTRWVEEHSLDSASYLRSKFYLQYWDPQQFLSTFEKGKSIFNSDSNAIFHSDLKFLGENDAIRKKWFTQPLARNQVASWLKEASDYADDTSNPINIPEQLKESHELFINSLKKKPAVAAGLSALVPGLGKYYAGRKKSFPIVLFTHLVYSAQSYEAIRKTGIRSAFTIISISYFSVYYLSNIYGSYKAVHKVRNERKKQFLLDAADHYQRTFGYPLY